MNEDELLAAFESGQIDGSDFPHERHVRVAWALSRRYARDDALRRLIAGLQVIAARAGQPSVFHVTITRAWFELIAGAEDVEAHQELFDKSLLGRYYSDAALAAGRTRWVEPDLHPLELPPPDTAPPADLAGVLRAIPTAVAVLGVRTGASVHAATVSSLTSVSREPALVSACLARGSRTLALVDEAQRFTLSVLASDQDCVADRFADPMRPTGAAQFAEVAHRLEAFGPVIEAAAAWLGCDVHARHRCGDHDLVVGRVRRAGRCDVRPLVRHDGAYH